MLFFLNIFFINRDRRLYCMLLYTVMFMVSMHTTIVRSSDFIPSDLQAPGAPLEQETKKCPCFDCGKLWFSGEHPLSELEREVADAIKRLPIAIESKEKDTSKRTFPLLQLVFEYCPTVIQWLLFNKIHFEKRWSTMLTDCIQEIDPMTISYVEQPSHDQQHVTQLQLGFTWKLISKFPVFALTGKGVRSHREVNKTGGGSLDDFIYLNNATTVFEKKDADQLQAMIRLSAQEHKGKQFTFKSVCGKFKTTITVGEGITRYTSLNVAPRIQAYLQKKNNT